VPVETDKRPVLHAFVLQKLGTLLFSKLIQISTRKRHITSKFIRVQKKIGVFKNVNEWVFWDLGFIGFFGFLI